MKKYKKVGFFLAKQRELFFVILGFFLLFVSVDSLASEENRDHISIGQKVYQGQRDYVFRDQFGREAIFRGWNVSGAVKLISMNFMPFKNTKDARRAFKDLRKRTGTNIVRFTIGWEGVHTGPNQYNKEYLNQIVSQMKAAIENKIHVIVDYHQDLYSRYIWHKKSKFSGNGAPKWIIPKRILQKREKCLLCTHWGVNNKLNKVTMEAFRSFWNNEKVIYQGGEYFVQDEFIKQVGAMARAVKTGLTPDEFSYIIGINPFNEPVDGGMEKLSPNEWYHKKLYPFYFNIKKEISKSGWDKKFVFGEPLVFWNTSAPTVSADLPPKIKKSRNFKGMVFNTHYYDALRMSIGLRSVKNGSYIGNFDHIRNRARELKTPPFITEFGMWIQSGRVKNQVRMIKASYQGMEVSKEKGNNFVKFYSPTVSGTQWHWDIYHDTHREPFNGTDRMITKGDAWNHEDFSVITKGGKYTTPDRYIVERGWPRRIQGDLLHFHFNERPYDGRKETLSWSSIRLDEKGKTFFGNHRFLFVAWNPKTEVQAPTEIFLPPYMKEKDLIVFTNNGYFRPVSAKKSFQGPGLGIHWDKDQPLNPDSGLVFSLLTKEESKLPQFFLGVSDPNGSLTKKELDFIHRGLLDRVLNKRKSPVFLNGRVKVDGVHIGKKKVKFY